MTAIMLDGTDSKAIDLPTPVEIREATDFLSVADSSYRVVRVKDRFAVKFGNGISPAEAEIMKFLAANSKVPVPKVYKAFKGPESKMTFSIMEYIPGDNLQTLLPSLTPGEKANVCQLIKTAILDLRSIPPPEYLGGLDHRPYNDVVFWNEGLDPAISGPFADQEEMNKGLLRRLGQSENPPYVQLLQKMVDTTLHGHRTVFTHGDLQPKNIMVERIGSCEDGCPAFKSHAY